MERIRKTIGYGIIFAVHFLSLFFALFIDIVGSDIAVAIDNNIAIPNQTTESGLLIYLFLGSLISFIFLVNSMNSREN